MKAHRSRKQRALIEKSSANGNPPLPAIPPQPAHLPHVNMACGSTPAHKWSYPESSISDVPPTGKPTYAATPACPGIPGIPSPPHLPQVGMAHGLTPAHRGFPVSRMLDDPNSWYGLSYLGNPVHPGTPSVPPPPHLTQVHMAHGPAHSMVYTRFVPVRATLKCRGGYTVTWADRGENQSMNNQPKYNKGDLT